MNGSTIIPVKIYDSIYDVDPSASESDIARAEPAFFRTKFGKRETYDMYRGCLIVRYTRTYSDCRSERVTVPYLFGVERETGRRSTFCISTDCSGTTHAKRLIDAALDTGILRS